MGDAHSTCKIVFNGKEVRTTRWPFSATGPAPTVGKLISTYRRDHIPTASRAILVCVQQVVNGRYVPITDDYADTEIVRNAEYHFFYFHSSLGQTIPVNTVIAWDVIGRENSALTRWNTDNDHVILLLGESGIGKTTFINNIINMIRFSSLEEAVDSDDISILVPSVTCTEDDEGNPITVAIGAPTADTNEVLVPGQAATQRPQLHVFCHENKVFKLIDVPGTLDNRGTEQDRENMQYTLDCLLTFKKVHAICILLNPTENRLGTALKYNINLLFSHLHKSSAQNIMFCFTMARQVNFKGGNFIPILQNYLNELNEKSGVRLEANRDTTYYFDNEALIYWALQKNGHLDGSELPFYKNSWDKSRESLKRLLAKVSLLPPYEVRGLRSISLARKTLLEMIPLLAEMNVYLQKNKNLVKEAEAAIIAHSNNNRSIDLRNYRKIKQLTLEKQPIDYPRTVCVSRKCVKFVSIGSTPEFQTHYNTICHAHCYLKNIPVEKFPIGDLKYCAAFDCGAQTSCLNCKCPWSSHKHITYLANLLEKTVPNDYVERLIQAGRSTGTKEDVLKGFNQRAVNLQREVEVVNRVAVRFASFLRNNAIVAYNDSFASYLDLLIEQAREKSAATGDNREVEQLQEQKKLYENELSVFSNAVSFRELRYNADAVADLEIVGPIFCQFASKSYGEFKAMISAVFD